MKNNNSRKHFPQGHFSIVSSQFKLNQCDLFTLFAQKPKQIHKNATSAQLGLTRQSRSKIRINQKKYTTSLSAMIPKEDFQYKSKRCTSPNRNISQKNLLSHSVDFVKTEIINRDDSFTALYKKTSQTGFYKRPQTSISQTRMKEICESKKIFLSEKENTTQQIIQKYTQRNPITGYGIPPSMKKGIQCKNEIKSQIDEVLFQNRDKQGRKQWNFEK